MFCLEGMLIRIVRAWAIRGLTLILAAGPLSQFIADAAELRETPYMKLGRHAAPWVPRFVEVLQANRPPRWYADEFAVFKGAGGQEYFAVLWRGKERLIRTPQLEFHKLIRDPDGRLKLKYLRQFSQNFGSVGLVPPSGERISPDEPPVAVVSIWEGGLSPSNFRTRLIQLKRNTVDITPPFNVDKVVDIDGDGIYEVVAWDNRWLGSFDQRSAAGPHLPIILKRENKKFHLACSLYPDYYKKRAVALQDHGWITEFLPPGPEHEREARRYWLQSEDLVGALLSFAQIGSFDEARRIYRKFEALYAENKSKHGPQTDSALKYFGELLARAETLRHSACPVTAK